MSYASVKKDIILERAEPIFTTNSKKLVKLVADWQAHIAEAKAAKDNRKWYEFWKDGEIDRDMYYDYLCKTSRPEKNMDRAKGLIVLCEQSFESHVSLSDKDALWLGIDIGD